MYDKEGSLKLVTKRIQKVIFIMMEMIIKHKKLIIDSS